MQEIIQGEPLKGSFFHFITLKSFYIEIRKAQRKQAKNKLALQGSSGPEETMLANPIPSIFPPSIVFYSVFMCLKMNKILYKIRL